MPITFVYRTADIYICNILAARERRDISCIHKSEWHRKYKFYLKRNTISHYLLIYGISSGYRSPKRMKTESPVPPVAPHLYTNPLTHLMNLSPSSPAGLNPLAALTSATTTPLRTSLSEVRSPYSGMEGHQRRRVTHHDRGNPNLDPEEDLAKNREFYRVQDVRPPYTYAALIRAVREIPKQNNLAFLADMSA